MTGLSDITLRAAVMKTLADDVGERLGEDKDAIKGAMKDGDLERVTVRLPDGTKVASMPLVGGESAPRVTDENAFSQWVAKHRPGEMEQVVRDSYRKAVLTEAKKAGRAVDRQSGDIIPGITWEPTTPYVKVDFATGDTDGRELIRRAWRSGALSLPDMLALAPAETPEDDYGAPGDQLFFDDLGRFRSPELAALHAVTVQHGFSTREARRMLADARSRGDEDYGQMVTRWLESRGLTLDGDDEPARDVR